MDFRWDDATAAANLAKHGIDFEDAIDIFAEPCLQTRSDRDDEVRWKAIGILNGVEVAVVYTLRGPICRIISARRASAYERRAYHAAEPGRTAPRQD
jgi:uncharacterized protein